jgi:transcriptional regulator with XRE-family HTH domain
MAHPLRKFRQENEISQSEMARRLGLSRSFLQRVEAGTRMPGPDVTRKINAETGIPEREIRPDLADLIGAP